MQDNVKHIGDKRLDKVPADLDLKPYRDEHDTELLVRMAQAIERGDHPETHPPQKLHRAVHETIAHIKTNGGGHRHRRVADAKPRSSKAPMGRSGGKSRKRK